MDTTRPITKRQRNDQLDMAASRIYRRRFDIERLLEERRLERELREVWT